MADAPRSVYLLVPPDLHDVLLAPLEAHFARNERIAVIVERRNTERRPGIDDRILRTLSTPVTERRAQTIPRGRPALPPALERYAERVCVVQRLSPVRAGMADLDIGEVIRRAQAGDPDAPAEVLWRTHERVWRRLAAHLSDPREAEQAVRATYGFIFDRLGDFDPNAVSLEAWLDRVVDEHAERLRARR